MSFLTAFLALSPLAVLARRDTVSENHDENPAPETISSALDFRLRRNEEDFRKLEKELAQAKRERDEAILAGQTLEASLKEARASCQRLRRGLEQANRERAQAARTMRDEIAAAQANQMAAYQNALQQALERRNCMNPFADLEARLRAEGQWCHCVPGRHELLTRL